MKSGQLTRTLQGHSSSVDFMSFDRNLLISAGSDRFDNFTETLSHEHVNA